MKSKNITILLSILLIFSIGLNFSFLYKNKRSEGLMHYNQMTAFHYRQDQNLSEHFIYFIGDSHIQGLATQSIRHDSINYGIGSDTTEGVLKRLPLYSSIKQAKGIVLSIGFNDLKKMNNAKIIANIEAIIDSFPNNVPLLLANLHQIDPLLINKNYVDRIKNLNAFIDELCNKKMMLECIDSPFKDRLNREFHIGDGIHLNKYGYSMWINEINKALEQQKL